LKDYSELYEHIGNIVIERASEGDHHCLEIYEMAWKITKDDRNIFHDNCIHCKHVLKDEAGDKPVPNTDAETTHHQTGQLGSDCYTNG
jgi:hypothetical protein